MDRYLVEQYVPGNTERDLRLERERLLKAAAALAESGEAVRYLGAVFVREEETSFVQFEAGSRAAVERTFQRANVPFSRICEARSLDVDLKEEL